MWLPVIRVWVSQEWLIKCKTQMKKSICNETSYLDTNVWCVVVLSGGQYVNYVILQIPQKTQQHYEKFCFVI